ncbi:unnamed protein product [Haemonchus placei]|uniref:WD_REPEATS_REGION domain-containing protein n=1 Tax=Haemonchus placei TaxID=6290 RepID=A0A0N4WKD7_HAEPC|nr:unnamed protein product [Haemonchus placei]
MRISYIDSGAFPSQQCRFKDIAAPSNVFPPPVHATLSTRSRCVFTANPLTVHSLHNIDVEAPTLPFNGHVDCLRLSVDERNLAVASNDLIKLIDLTRGRGIRNLSGHSSTVKAITPRRSTVYSWVSGSLDSSWIVWDSRSHPANVLQVRTTGPVRCVELSPDDIILTVGTDSTLQLYDIRKREYLKQFPSPTHGATFHPSQRMVATFGAERVVRFWCLDELVQIAMSDAFSLGIRCAQFASPSSPKGDQMKIEELARGSIDGYTCPIHMDIATMFTGSSNFSNDSFARIDPVLCACTDHYVKTLTYEPCESLAVNHLGDLRKVLNMNVSADGVGVICTDSVGAVSYSVIPMEDLVQGPRESVDFSDYGEDDDVSLSDEVAILTLRGESPSIPLPRETISVPSAIHLSSSDCGIDNSLSSGSNRVSLPVRSSSSDRGTSHRTPSRNPLKRLRDGSRLICRSVSPLNGASTRETTFVVAPRSVEKMMRPLAPTTSTKPPREPNRSLQRDGRVNAYASTDDTNPQSRKNSTQGFSLDDFAAKVEKGHYMAIMQAEKTSIGVHQLTAALKHGGLCAMLKDGLFADESAVTVMLRMFNETKRWDINICSMYLSRIKGV